MFLTRYDLLGCKKSLHPTVSLSELKEKFNPDQEAILRNIKKNKEEVKKCIEERADMYNNVVFCETSTAGSRGRRENVFGDVCPVCQAPSRVDN